jgi:peptide/nickel transport system permease protein
VRSFLVRRIVQAVSVVAVVATVTFFLIHLAPGDPLGGALDDPRVSEAVRLHWRHVFGLDRPLGVQYLRFLAGIARGQFGYSIAYHEPVGTLIARAFPNTLLLAGTALAVSFVAGIAIALVQIAWRSRIIDGALGGSALVLYSLPDFWLAQVALLVFAYWLPVFPAGGLVDPVIHPYLGTAGAIADRVKHLILPMLTLAALSAGGVARFQRAALLGVVTNDYLRTARAKGVPEWQVIGRHALRNAVLPVITLFGLSLPGFLSGAVFVEKIFSWPGIGSLAVDAVAARDYPVVVACAVMGSVLVVTGSLAADLLSAVADPRLRVGSEIASGASTP